jgi:hypothetical protein
VALPGTGKGKRRHERQGKGEGAEHEAGHRCGAVLAGQTGRRRGDRAAQEPQSTEERGDCARGRPPYDSAPLTPAGVDLLVPLRHATEPVIARRLADRFGRSRANISKTLAKLERRGFVQRAPNPANPPSKPAGWRRSARTGTE